MLKSIYRLKTPLILDILDKNNPTIVSVKYGLKSLTQKKIVNGRKDGNEYFHKLPRGRLALNSLIIESYAIDVFENIGINTMKKFDGIGDFCYLAVKGKSEYLPNRIFHNCVSKYPIAKRSTILDYFSTNDFFDKKSLDVNKEIDLTISHGDLTVWNTFYDNNNFTLIDLEFFSESRVKYFDIFYYIFSYEFYRKKSNSEIMFDVLSGFMKTHKIESLYLIIFLYDLLASRKNDLSDGVVDDLRSRSIIEITNLIDIFEMKQNE